MLLRDLVYEMFLAVFKYFASWLSDLVLGLLPE